MAKEDFSSFSVVSVEPCPCGRGDIEYETVDGVKVSKYSTPDTLDLDCKEPVFSPCCKECEEDYEREAGEELFSVYEGGQFLK